MPVEDIVARLLETDDFDPRAYLAAGDWTQALPARGWAQSPLNPADMLSFRKTYQSSKGWYMTVWVEEDNEDKNFVQIVAFGPNGDLMVGNRVKPEDVLEVVEVIEKLFNENLTYEETKAKLKLTRNYTPVWVEEHVPTKVVDRLLEVEEFDPRSYFLTTNFPKAEKIEYTPAWRTVRDGGRVVGWYREPDPTGKFGDPDFWTVRLSSDRKARFKSEEECMRWIKAQLSDPDNLREAEEFDPREYLLNDPISRDWEGLKRGLTGMGWRLKELPPERAMPWGQLFTKDTIVNNVECRIYAYISPEPPFEVTMVVRAAYEDDQGNTVHKDVEQMKSECQLGEGESMETYLKVISDLEAGLHVPSQEDFEFEG